MSRKGHSVSLPISLHAKVKELGVLSQRPICNVLEQLYSLGEELMGNELMDSFYDEYHSISMIMDAKRMKQVKERFKNGKGKRSTRLSGFIQCILYFVLLDKKMELKLIERLRKVEKREVKKKKSLGRNFE